MFTEVAMLGMLSFGPNNGIRVSFLVRRVQPFSELRQSRMGQSE